MSIVLNSHFQQELNISASMASGLSACVGIVPRLPQDYQLTREWSQSAYFGAYFICPPTISGWILRRFGFRVTFMTGLAVLAVGCLLFWPSGVKKSFGGFCGSMFVVGMGLSTLETAADPFLSVCGPPRWVVFGRHFSGSGRSFLSSGYMCCRLVVPESSAESIDYPQQVLGD